LVLRIHSFSSAKMELITGFFIPILNVGFSVGNYILSKTVYRVMFKLFIFMKYGNES